MQLNGNIQHKATHNTSPGFMFLLERERGGILKRREMYNEPHMKMSDVNVWHLNKF